MLAGEKCAKIIGNNVRNIPVNDVECDEIWAYVGKKEGHKTEQDPKDAGLGDTYLFCGN